MRLNERVGAFGQVLSGAEVNVDDAVVNQRLAAGRVAGEFTGEADGAVGRSFDNHIRQAIE